MAEDEQIRQSAQNEQTEQFEQFEQFEQESDDLESTVVEVNGTELYEHFRFVADKGQELLRVDKFLVTRLPPRQGAYSSTASL